MGRSVRKSRKIRKYYRVVNLGLFPFDILVCQGMPLSTVRNYIKRRWGIRIEDHEAWSDDGSRLGKTLFLNTKQTIVWLANPPTTPGGISTLAHEALHAIIGIYKVMGVPLTAENDEAIAYGLDHIVEEVLKDFKK